MEFIGISDEKIPSFFIGNSDHVYAAVEAPLFFFILSCDMTLLLYQDIACISKQNVLKHFACLAKRSPLTK